MSAKIRRVSLLVTDRVELHIKIPGFTLGRRITFYFLAFGIDHCKMKNEQMRNCNSSPGRKNSKGDAKWEFR